MLRPEYPAQPSIGTANKSVLLKISILDQRSIIAGLDLYRHLLLIQDLKKAPDFQKKL
jgi:hypothetical protein